MNLNEKFIMLRKSKSLSVYKLSKIADVSENYIRTIEKGNSQPSVFILEKLLLSLGTTISEFFNESDDILYPTALEKELVESVRMLDEEKATAILNMAKLLRQWLLTLHWVGNFPFTTSKFSLSTAILF